MSKVEFYYEKLRKGLEAYISSQIEYERAYIQMVSKNGTLKLNIYTTAICYEDLLRIDGVLQFGTGSGLYGKQVDSLRESLNSVIGFLIEVGDENVFLSKTKPEL